ncbi:2,4-dichlorophenol 6-monooxygenase [Nocardioides albertanoniae]|uniref:2,4-dichlorophenol 6-monooxygenase n=1 Tax=Nocardioides albertanoniae TaxID=1175486 RepID=A0A543A5R7_9ACTN|nr:FAD-dependent monooxygenase [Nocardioides albertanoniae]TQL67914.1 2,4-dichlorophenol 6-monooxygenase [Nocardioides albertanoniae]
MRIEETDVLVVGAGPAGLTATALLAREGVAAVTVDKYADIAHTPRAHITNQRAMEVFRDLGIEDRVLERALVAEGMGTNVWATSVAGRELARMYAWGSGPDRRSDYDNASPCAMCNIGQHDLEPVLRDRALELGADLRFSQELVDITQDDVRVEATVLERETGETYLLRAKYVVAADGGRSLVAHKLEFDFEGETGLGAAVNVWLEADLEKYRKDRPGALFFTIQPGRDFWLGAGTFITVRPWNEWVLIIVYNPETEQLDLSEEALTLRARKVIGDPDVDIRIKNVSQWQLNHVVARSYRKGRVFIAGDAAHRHPPANGLGSNTSVQDAYNLAWKLAHVVRGQAGDGLLDSYDAERQPVGKQVVDRALQSVGAFGQIPSIFGVTEGQTDEEGWAELDGFFSDTESGRARRQRLTEVLAENEYHFNAHGVELGQRYASGAVVSDGPPPAYTRDPQLYYHPTTYPGAYLPHEWVVRDGQRVSTLDLAGEGRFTLITGTGGQHWTDAAAKVGAELGVDIQTVAIGRGQEVDDAYGAWSAASEIDDHGALLVRPDRYVAWRCSSHDGDPTATLRAVLTSVLDRT